MFTFAGYRHFLKYVKRTGKSKLSLQKLVKQIQKSFSPEEWYYYRKVHKKQGNYFLNKGGQKGDQGGGGWVAFETKMSKSTNSKISSKSGGGISSVEETKSGIIQKANSLVGIKQQQHGSKRVKGGRIRTLSNSEFSSSAKGSNDDVDLSDKDSWTVSHDMLMIDEVHTSEESENLSSRHTDLQNK